MSTIAEESCSIDLRDPPARGKGRVAFTLPALDRRIPHKLDGSCLGEAVAYAYVGKTNMSESNCDQGLKFRRTREQGPDSACIWLPARDTNLTGPGPLHSNLR